MWKAVSFFSKKGTGYPPQLPATVSIPKVSFGVQSRKLFMRIVYAAFGSRGDTQPHIAFAVEVSRLPRVRVSESSRST